MKKFAGFYYCCTIIESSFVFVADPGALNIVVSVGHCFSCDKQLRFIAPCKPPVLLSYYIDSRLILFA